MNGANMNKRKRDSCRPQFPQDIIFNVLLTPPAKSLMRFKAVCKAWHSLIRDPYFAESHHTRSQTRPDASYLLFHSHKSNHSLGRAIVQDLAIVPTNLDGVFSTQLPVQTSDENSMLVHRGDFTNIVNGLICLWEEEWPRLHVLNLTTGEKIAIPVGEKMPHIQDVFCQYYLLGFEPISKQYKVLYICSESYRRKTQRCFVITVGGNNSWRRVTDAPDLPLLRNNNSTLRSYNNMSVCVNGAIYSEDKLFMYGGRVVRYDEFYKKFDLLSHGERVLQYFDIAEEKFKLLSIHNQVGNKIFGTEFITEVGGNFTFGGRDGGSWEITFWTLINKPDQVWVMSKIMLPEGDFNGVPLNIVGLGDTNTAKVLIRSSPWSPKRGFSWENLYVYDLQNKEDYKTVNLLFEGKSCFSVSHHVENILPLNIPCGKDKRSNKKGQAEEIEVSSTKGVQD